MDEGLLALFEGIKEDFLTLSLDDFTNKAHSESQKLDIQFAIKGTSLSVNWQPFRDAKRTAVQESYPLSLREDAYKRLKYKVDEVIAKIRSGSTSVMKKRITVEVVNAISDPKIKQICIELNNTPDQNILSLAQSLGEALQWTLWYRAQQFGTSMTVSNMKLNRLLEDAINHPYYSSNAAVKFLKDFKYGFLKTGYDMVRHDPAYIPDIIILNPAIDALEHVLKETFPIEP